MSTRGAIARPTDMGWEGRYHHFDSYPMGLGATLFRAYHEDFDNDAEKMQTVLIDNHPGGWSNINGVDWSQPPGFIEYGSDHTEAEMHRPVCYCHGDRNEGPFPLMVCHCQSGSPIPEGVESCDPVFIEYAYVITKIGLELWHAVGDKHERYGLVSWDGPEPDWEKIDNDMRAIEERAYAAAGDD